VSLEDRLAAGIKASIEGQAQGDFEYWLRASTWAPTHDGAMRCLARAAKARALLSPEYMRRRLSGIDPVGE